MIEREVYQISAVVDWMKWHRKETGRRPLAPTVARMFPYYEPNVIEFAIQAFEEPRVSVDPLQGMTVEERALYVQLKHELKLVKQANRLLSTRLEQSVSSTKID
jgi:hypothetical protein